MMIRIHWPYYAVVLLLILLALLLSSALSVVNAQGDYTQQQAITLTVSLGDDKNLLRFYPSELTLETGKLYRLVLFSPSSSKHYFSSYALSQKVHTRKVQIMQANQQVAAEVKGAIREIEVYPGQTAEWWFVLVQTGTLNDLHCAIKGHREAGMVGKIIIH